MPPLLNTVTLEVRAAGPGTILVVTAPGAFTQKGRQPGAKPCNTKLPNQSMNHMHKLWPPVFVMESQIFRLMAWHSCICNSRSTSWLTARSSCCKNACQSPHAMTCMSCYQLDSCKVRKVKMTRMVGIHYANSSCRESISSSQSDASEQGPDFMENSDACPWAVMKFWQIGRIISYADNSQGPSHVIFYYPKSCTNNRRAPISCTYLIITLHGYSISNFTT